MKQFNSKFETYLLDQELEIENNEKVECLAEEQKNLESVEQYPEGFFSSL